MATNKRGGQPKALSQSSPSPSQRLKSSSKASHNMCPVCDEIVQDDIKSQKAQESIMCEGECNKWLHRGCAGLSKKRFVALRDSSEVFVCLSCCLKAHTKEIRELWDDIKFLKEEIAELKSAQSTSVSMHGEKSVQSTPGSTREDAIRSTEVYTMHSTQNGTVSTPSLTAPNFVSTPSLRTAPKFSNARNAADEDRRFNVVVFGVRECKEGLHYKQRFVSDLNDISSLFSSSTCPSNPSSSIKDCRRLGKYDSNKINRSRPILVHFNSCKAVMDILANRSSFSPYVVKPDMSPTARSRERILLKERWNLCQSGVEKSSVKIKGTSLIVNGRAFGKVVNDSRFIRFTDDDACDVSVVNESTSGTGNTDAPQLDVQGSVDPSPSA